VGAERWDEQVGSVADEAGRLLESLRRSAAAAANAADAATGGAAGPEAGAPSDGSGSDPAAPGSQGPPEHATDGPGVTPPAHDPFCTYCPLCRGAAVIRSLSPETLSRLSELAGLAATVLADLASTRTSGDSPASAPAPAPAPTATSRPIPVHDADDPKEAPRG